MNVRPNNNLDPKRARLIVQGIVAFSIMVSVSAQTQHAGHAVEHDRAEAGEQQGGYGVAAALPAETRAQLDAAKASIQANYSTPEKAEAAGWRRPRSSTPTMGEHWSNPQLVRQAGFDPNNPEILMFAPINGELKLVGASWMNRQGADEDVPPLFTGLENMWHRHGASDALNRAQAAVAAANGRQARQSANGIVMNHLWFIDAQDGEFTGHNHWMPFMDAGLPIPPAEIRGEILGKAAVALGEVNGSAFIVETYYSLLSDTARAEVDDYRERIRELIPAYKDAHGQADLGEMRAVLAAMGSHWEMIRAVHSREFSPEVANLLDVAYGNMVSADEHSSDGHTH